jgi:hypothetical protein
MRWTIKEAHVQCTCPHVVTMGTTPKRRGADIFCRSDPILYTSACDPQLICWRLVIHRISTGCVHWYCYFDDVRDNNLALRTAILESVSTLAWSQYHAWCIQVQVGPEYHVTCHEASKYYTDYRSFYRIKMLTLSSIVPSQYPCWVDLQMMLHNMMGITSGQTNPPSRFSRGPSGKLKFPWFGLGCLEPKSRRIRKQLALKWFKLYLNFA